MLNKIHRGPATKTDTSAEFRPSVQSRHRARDHLEQRALRALRGYKLQCQVPVSRLQGCCCWSTGQELPFKESSVPERRVLDSVLSPKLVDCWFLHAKMSGVGWNSFHSRTHICIHVGSLLTACKPVLAGPVLASAREIAFK